MQMSVIRQMSVLWKMCSLTERTPWSNVYRYTLDGIFMAGFFVVGKLLAGINYIADLPKNQTDIKLLNASRLIPYYVKNGSPHFPPG